MQQQQQDGSSREDGSSNGDSSSSRGGSSGKEKDHLDEDGNSDDTQGDYSGDGSVEEEGNNLAGGQSSNDEGEGRSTMEDTDIKTAMERRVMAEMVMEPARVTGGMENTKETIIEREMEKADGGMTKAAETETGLMDSNAFVVTRAAARELKRAEQERKQKQKEWN